MRGGREGVTFTRTWPKFSELLRRGLAVGSRGRCEPEPHYSRARYRWRWVRTLGMVSGSRQLAPLLVMIPITKKQLEPAGCP